MEILNVIDTLLRQINTDGVSENRLQALAEALSKIDAAMGDNPSALKAKALLLSEQNKELRAEADRKPAAEESKKVKVKWRGERYYVEPGAPINAKDDKGRKATLFATKDEARRAIDAALHPETTMLGMVDPKAAELAFLARRRETDGILGDMKARGEVAYQKKKWGKKEWALVAGAVVGGVGVGVLAYEGHRNNWWRGKTGEGEGEGQK